MKGTWTQTGKKECVFTAIGLQVRVWSSGGFLHVSCDRIRLDVVLEANTMEAAKFEALALVRKQLLEWAEELDV